MLGNRPITLTGPSRQGLLAQDRVADLRSAAVENTMAALRRRLVGHAAEFSDEYSDVTISYDYGYMTITVDEDGRCSVSRARAVPGEEGVSHGDGLTLDALGLVLYRALCEAVEEAECCEAENKRYAARTGLGRLG